MIVIKPQPPRLDTPYGLLDDQRFSAKKKAVAGRGFASLLLGVICEANRIEAPRSNEIGKILPLAE